MTENQTARNLYDLREMIRALQEPAKTAILEQLELMIDSITDQERSFHAKISMDMHDIQVLLTAMQFDLESTKRERDKYRAMLGE
jgi:hypothetical protein